MLNVILHSVELYNINTQANRLIQSVVPISTKWDHTDMREGSHTGSGEGKKTIEKFFRSSFNALYSAEDDSFLTWKTTDLKFQEVILHIKYPGSSDWLQGRLRNWSTSKALLGTCWLYRAHLPNAPRWLGKAVVGSARASFWGETLGPHPLKPKSCTEWAVSWWHFRARRSPGPHLSVLIACQSLEKLCLFVLLPLATLKPVAKHNLYIEFIFS